jgi:hypothetical protein
MDIVSTCCNNDIFDSPRDLKPTIILNITDITCVEKALNIKRF